MSTGREAHEPLRVCPSREVAERLAARLRAAGIDCGIEAPAPPLRQLPPGTWTVTVSASLLQRAVAVIDPPQARLPAEESCE